MVHLSSAVYRLVHIGSADRPAISIKVQLGSNGGWSFVPLPLPMISTPLTGRATEDKVTLWLKNLSPQQVNAWIIEGWIFRAVASSGTAWPDSITVYLTFIPVPDDQIKVRHWTSRGPMLR